MKCFIIVGVLGLGLVAPSGAVRLSSWEEDASAQGMLPAADDCQDYPDGLGFKIGDRVWVHKPGSKLHHAESIVKCPEKLQGATEGRVCLEAMGCWDPRALRRMPLVMSGLYSMSARLEAAAQNASSEIEAIFKNFVDMILTKLNVAAAKIANIWDRFLNPCSEGSRQAVASAFASAKAQVSILASWAQDKVDNMPGGRAAFRVTVASLGAVLSSLNETVLESEEGRRLAGSMAATLESIKEVAKQKLRRAQVSELARNSTAFANSVAMLTGWLEMSADDVYRSPLVQSLLSELQSITGDLLALAGYEVEAQHEDVNVMAQNAVEEVEGYGTQAVAAFKFCDGDFRREAEQVAKDVFVFVEVKVKTYITAIQQNWTASQLSIRETAEEMQQTMKDISDRAKDGYESVWSSESLQDLLVQIDEQIDLLMEFSEERDIEIPGKVQGVMKRIQKLTRVFSRRTTGELDDEQEDAVFDAVTGF